MREAAQGGGEMAPPELVRTFYETVVSQHRLEDLPRFVEEGCVLRQGEGTTPLGPGGMVRHLAALRETYPDYTVRILRQHWAAPYVVSECVMEGTHLGPWPGTVPTGKRLIFTGVNIDAWAGILVALIIGIPAGIISAKKQYSVVDNVSMVLSLIGVSMPNFWFGLLVVIVFALNLGWLPSQGMGEGGVELLKSLVLPALTLGTGCAATITRMTRSSMLEVIHQDYIDTAKAKGVSERTITFRHMLKNALIPIVTAVGLQFGTLLGGAMLTETVFSWPGLGRLMVDSIKSKDIPMVLGSVVFMAVMFSIVNLTIDIIYAFVDPRIKSLYKKK